jgi:hypothetical protein
MSDVEVEVELGSVQVKSKGRLSSQYKCCRGWGYNSSCPAAWAREE